MRHYRLFSALYLTGAFACAILAVVDDSLYDLVFAVFFWQARDILDLRSELRHVQNRVDAINGP